ncbi:MAG: hypothetical protein WC994_03055 [Brumimicrobium sp.]
MFRSLLIVFFMILGGFSFAQISTNSPYSAKGIGDVSFYGDAYTNGLGGAAVALTDSNQVNLYNPSTYSLIAKQLPLFSLGLNHYQRRFSNNGVESKGQYTGITHMILAIPFSKRFGVAAGLKPFSHSGYEINDSEVIQGDSIFHDYTGRGDVQEVFLGFSGNILQGNKHSLSIGIQGKRYFSGPERSRNSYIKSNDVQSGGIDKRHLRGSGFGVDFGMNYSFQPTREHRVRIAATYRPGIETGFKKDETRYFYQNFFDRNSYDTIISLESIKGQVYLPSKTSVGFTYSYLPYNESKGSAKRTSLMLAFEYTMEDWSKYREEFEGTMSSGQYIDMTSYRLGVEYIPHRYSLDRSVYINYFDKINYRIGGYLVNTPSHVNGNQIIDKGVTFGLGFPFIMGRAVSTVNFSANYGVLNGKGDASIVKDTYFGFNLGINIAPGFDRWFRKYKLD